MTTDPKQEFLEGWLALNNRSEEKHRARERHRKTKGASESKYVRVRHRVSDISCCCSCFFHLRQVHKRRYVVEHCCARSIWFFSFLFCFFFRDLYQEWRERARHRLRWAAYAGFATKTGRRKRLRLWRSTARSFRRNTRFSWMAGSGSPRAFA